MKLNILTVTFIFLAFCSKAQEVKKEYYPNGKLKSKTYMVNGKAHGPVDFYYESGQLLGLGIYVEGYLNGPYISYYENGNVKAMGRYYNNKLDVFGVIFYENGKVQRYGEVQKEKRSGYWMYHDTDGNFKEKKYHSVD